MGIHQLYPDWIGRADVAGFAQAGTAEKLGIDCSLVVKNPEEVGITASEVLHRKLTEESAESGSRIYDIRVEYKF